MVTTSILILFFCFIPTILHDVISPLLLRSLLTLRSPYSWVFSHYSLSPTMVSSLFTMLSSLLHSTVPYSSLFLFLCIDRSIHHCKSILDLSFLVPIIRALSLSNSCSFVAPTSPLFRWLPTPCLHLFGSHPRLFFYTPALVLYTSVLSLSIHALPLPFLCFLLWMRILSHPSLFNPHPLL